MGTYKKEPIVSGSGYYRSGIINMVDFKDENDTQSPLSNAHVVVSNVAANAKELCMPEEQFPVFGTMQFFTMMLYS